jgi:hypothetical protein
MTKITIIRSIYLYVVTLIGLLMIVFPVASLIDTSLKTWVFPNADESYYECPINAPRPVSPELKEQTTLTPEEEQVWCEKNREVSKKGDVRRRQANAVRNISFLIVGIPLFLFHFKIVQKERKESNA